MAVAHEHPVFISIIHNYQILQYDLRKTGMGVCIQTGKDRQTVSRLRRAHKEEPQLHYAPGFDLLAGAKQTQKLAYTASNREMCLKLQTKSVAFVLLNTGEGPRRLGGRQTTL